MGPIHCPETSMTYYKSTLRNITEGKGKGKVHPCTGTEALYRPYGP